MWTLEVLPPEETASMGPPAPQAPPTAAQAFYLVAGEFIAGRKDCDLVLGWDRSVSRRHAKLTVRPLREEEVRAVGTLQAISVTDLESKFHTKVNGEVLAPHTPKPLRSGDVLVFGTSVRLRLRTLPLVLCLSRFSSQGKQALKAAAAKAGAHVVDKWGPTCTHLVVEQPVTATTKVAFAVVHGRPVVDAAWVTEGLLARRESLAAPLPETKDYKPDWSQVQSVRMLDKDRRTHLAGLLLLFPRADETEELVRDAGAQVHALCGWVGGFKVGGGGDVLWLA